MKKLIVSAFDGTLINSEEEIPTSTVMLFDELRRRDYKIAIATSRNLKMIIDYNHDFPFLDYIISSNGAFIYDTVLEKVVYKKNILISNVRKIITKFYEQSIIYLIDNLNLNLISEESVYEQDCDIVKIDDYSKFLDENKNIYKMELYFNDYEEAKRALEIIENFHLKLSGNLKRQNGKYMLEITHQDVNKFEGVKKLVAKSGVSIEDVIAFGDDYTDIDLIRNVGMGVAVKDAVLEVKEVAKDITDDCNHKGVENYLRNNIRI